MNGISEFYPIFDFIRHPVGTSRAAFTEAIRDGPKFLETQLRDVMMRRSYATKLFGSRLVDLSSTSHTVLSVESGSLESKLYKFVLHRFKAWAHELCASTSADKRHTRALMLELIMRLRQMASHPITIQYVLVALLQKDDIEKLLKIVNPKLYDQKVDIDLANHMRKVVNKSIGPQGKQFRQTAKLKALSEAAKQRGQEGYTPGIQTRMPSADQPCQKCGRFPDDPRLTSCHHMYCPSCLEEMAQEWASHELDGCLCRAPGCGQLFQSCEEYFPELGHNVHGSSSSSSSDTNDDEVYCGVFTATGDTMGDLTQAVRKCRMLPDGDVEDWLDEDGRLWDSAKLSRLRKELKEMLVLEKVKVLVFTQ